MFSGKITLPDALEIRNSHVAQFWLMKSQEKAYGASERFVEQEACVVFLLCLFPFWDRAEPLIAMKIKVTCHKGTRRKEKEPGLVSSYTGLELSPKLCD